MTTSIYWQLFEDDKTCSALWQDLAYLVRSTKRYPRVQIAIHYHSVNAYGSYTIRIHKGVFQMEPMDRPVSFRKALPDHADVVRDLQTLLKPFDPSHRNILNLSGHVNIFFKTNKWLSTDLMSKLPRSVHFDLMVMDACTSVYWPWLLACQDRCDYLLGCESSSPYLGFMGPSFLDILVDEFYGSTPKRIVAKHWIDAFLQRNDTDLPPYQASRCDASMVDMTRFRAFLKAHRQDTDYWIRYARAYRTTFRGAKLEFHTWYPLYDLVAILAQVDEMATASNLKLSLAPALEKCVLYVKISRAQRKHLRQHGQRATAYRGISMFLL